MNKKDMVKACEKGCLKAYGKMMGICLLIYGVILGGFYGWFKWNNQKSKDEETETAS